MTLKDLHQEKDEESFKKHTDEIELNEKYLSLIYDTLSEMIFLLAVEPDDCFRFMSVNQAFLAATGLTREQVVGKRIEQVLPETAQAVVISKYKEAIVENKIVSWEQASTYPTSESVGAVTVTPVRNAEGVCTHLVGTVHDITEFRRAKKEIRNLQRYNRKLIEVSLDPLVTFDHEGVILDVNEATIQATGKSREELIGTPFADYFTDSEKAHQGVMMVFQMGEVRDYELVMKAKDGTET
ncbi:MAG: PAS domain S-box protein, partial [ANME-2 cluster archaeon]|nr:PAS domain S-box protein [ANME-2 cluster archaeon]